jgi:hypothetical protein
MLTLEVVAVVGIRCMLGGAKSGLILVIMPTAEGIIQSKNQLGEGIGIFWIFCFFTINSINLGENFVKFLISQN